MTCLLYAASPAGTGLGIEWALEAAEDVTVPLRWPNQVSTDASWATAALWCGHPLFEARVRGILNMVDKQRDSVKMTVTKALTPWLRTSIRDRGLPVFDPLSLDDAAITLYVLSPSDGTVAPLAVTLMEQLIRRQRVKVAQWEEFPRIGMFLDELPNTPLRRSCSTSPRPVAWVCRFALRRSRVHSSTSSTARCKGAPSVTSCPRR